MRVSPIEANVEGLLRPTGASLLVSNAKTNSKSSTPPLSLIVDKGGLEVPNDENETTEDRMEAIRAARDPIEHLRRLSESLVDPDFAAQLFEEGYPDAVVVVDRQGHIKLLNRNLEFMFGYHRTELYDRPVEVLLPDSVRAAHVNHRSKYTEDPHTRPMGLGMVLKGKRKDGTEFDVEISLSPILARQGYFTVATIRKKRMEVANVALK